MRVNSFDHTALVSVEHFPVNRTVMFAAAIMAILGLMLMIAAPMLPVRSVELVPSHSHLFLSAEAAAAHNHAPLDTEADDSEVVNLGGHSGNSPGSASIGLVDAQIAVTSKTTATFVEALAERSWNDPPPSPPDPPPVAS